MPPEPLPFDRKDIFKERKPSSSEPAGAVPAQWREPPTTSSSHYDNHGPFSCRLGGAGRSSDFRRPFSGHGKQVGGGWHAATVESGPREDKICRYDSSRENNHTSSGALASSSQEDRKGGNSRETTASPNGNSHPHPGSINSWDQHQSKDEHDKNDGGGVCTTGGQRLENESSLGSSIDWKPLKWIRSGSLSSRGSGFSHSSSSKSIGMDSVDIKIDGPPGNSSPLQSPSGDAVPCLTPRTPADEVSSRKKPRLGWGEGLAKYEKKKVGPDDIVDKEAETKNGTVDCVNSLEPALSSPSNLPDKSPSLTGCSECSSPATPYSFACSSSPGLEEKASTKTAAVDNDTCNPSVPSCHMSHDHTEGSTFNLENLELTEVDNFSFSLNELLQSDDTNAPASGFVRSTAMDKLQVWKADITRTLEITESEIDSLENELKLLVSDVGGSCSLPAASCSSPTQCNVKDTDGKPGPLPLRIIASGDTVVEKADGFVEVAGVEDLDRESPGTATSKFVEPFTLCDAAEQMDSSCILHIRSENMEAKCSEDNVSNDMLGVATACGDGSQLPADGCTSMVPLGSDVHYSRTDKLHELVLDSNKVLANEASNEFRKLLPSKQWCNNTLRVTNDSQVKEKFAMRKRFLKFKERAITLKFRAFQYLWKEDLRLLSVPRFGAKSQKKFELSSRMGYPDYQKHRSSIRSRFSYPAGKLSLVPTREMIDYASKLLSDSHVRVYRNTLKMPSLILDKREHTTSRFISYNGLVENPCDVEMERSVINPWTSEEKEIFLDKFSLFGKDFRNIASFLEHKTVADCVEFYYKNHKCDRFQKTKKNSEFAKRGKSHSTNTYMVTSGKRWNRETNAASLDMLGAASAMAADVDGGKERRQKCTSKFYVGTSRDHKLPQVDGGILERSDSLVMYCNERETAAADVLAGICGSISSEALSSCITSLADHGDVYQQDRISQKLGGFSTREPATPEGSQNDVDEETCSDDSCGRETDPSDWTDEEKSSFLHALRSYGKDFSMISRSMRTRSRDQCKVFFSKARRCLGLDAIHLERGGEGAMGGNRGGRSDHDDTCMVDSGSVISCDKSSSEFKMEVEDLHSSDSKQELAESERNVVNGCRASEFGSDNLVLHGWEAENKPEIDLVGGRASDSNIEEADDSEATRAANLEEASRNTYCEGSVGETNDQASASGAKAEVDTVGKVSVKICREGIQESEHQLVIWNSNTSELGEGLNVFPAEDLNSASHCPRGSSLDLSIEPGNSLELNGVEKPCERNNGFLASNLVCRDPIVSPHRKTMSQDDTSSSSLSFRKSMSQRSSSTDGHHLHLPKHSLMDCVESSQILRGYPITVSTNKGSVGQNKFKLGKNLPLEHCLPRDCSLQMCTSSLSQEQSQGDVGKPGDVKLFGQILTNPLSNGKFEKPNGIKSFNLKFDNHSADDRNLASLDLDNHGFGVKKNVSPLRRSYGFWDGNRIQTGFSSLPPDSSILLAKYPAAFANTTKLEQCHTFVHEQVKQKREVSRCSKYHNGYMSQEGIQPFTVDKLLLSEMLPRRKDSEGEG